MIEASKFNIPATKRGSMGKQVSGPNIRKRFALNKWIKLGLWLLLAAAMPGRRYLVSDAHAATMCTPDDPSCATGSGDSGGNGGQGGSLPPMAQTPVTGTAEPRYLVVSVAYAPPGSATGQTSFVTYGTGSSQGVTTSITKEFKKGITVTAKVTVGPEDGNHASLSGEFNYETNAEQKDAVDVDKSKDASITLPGGTTDSVDHNLDRIYVWLKPTLNVSATDSSVSWALDGQNAQIVYLYVGWLKDPSLIPQGLRSVLSAAGLTDGDLADILAYDGLANEKNPEQAGLEFTHITVPWEPSFDPSDAPVSWMYSIDDSLMTTGTKTAGDEHSVSVTLSGELNVAFAKLSASAAGMLTWTYSKQVEHTATNRQSASVTLTSPSYGYDGPVQIGIYWDPTYKTFAFVPTTFGVPSVGGTVVDAQNRPVPHVEVILRVAGTTYRTFTNNQGGYSLFVPEQGQAEVVVDGAAPRSLVLGPAASSADFVAPTPGGKAGGGGIDAGRPVADGGCSLSGRGGGSPIGGALAAAAAVLAAALYRRRRS